MTDRTEREGLALKPCPFCGGDAQQCSGTYYYWCVCSECGAEGPLDGNEGLAIAAWNRRPTEALAGK